ncbi:SEL1-like repeat protein [Marimonas arenosa]|uniref:SEL1-like repeat protein n=1 Tax=Marimonas arenosa TaxID=1795305 RepID=A0AAE3WGY6_9RHOB|nr:SEL1-like repeat protein [Marimonas arenosa]MDQ2092205.1 SEL1-like repeat protein [Marimonas arenosa]
MTERRRAHTGAVAALLAAMLSGPATAQTTATPMPQPDATAPTQAKTPEALFAEGLRYHAGDGVPQSFAAAAEWFAKAADLGHPAAQNHLGRYYHAGYGVDKDQAQALKWLAAAAQAGEPQYLHDLARALENGADGSSDPAGAADFYTAAANLGHLESKVSLGVLFQNGTGVDQDYNRARALYAEAAEAGNARARNNLGLLYVRGHGVPQDYARAAALFAQAAEQGMPQALTNLGVMYENGFGVELDEARAQELYRLGGQTGRSDGTGEVLPRLVYDPRLAPPAEGDDAMAVLQAQVRGGDPVAMFQLGWLLARPDNAPYSALTQAAALFRTAAERGYGPAMVNLGLMHFDGRGVLQDYVQGQMWLTLAEAAGQKGAAELGLRYSDVMTAAQINEAQARAAARLRQ